MKRARMVRLSGLNMAGKVDRIEVATECGTNPVRKVMYRQSWNV